MASRPWEREALGLAPVFIVGDARSGTKILYRSIQSHPLFRPALGINFAESNAIRLLLGVFGREDVRRNNLAQFLIGPAGLEALRKVAEDIEPLALRRKLVRRAAGRSIKRLPLWQAAGEHHVVRRYFLEATRRRNVGRLVEKTPTHIHWVPHLATAFPDARFIFIARHPIDALSSYWKRYQLDPITAPWANLTSEAFCAHWENAIQRALTLSKHDPRFLLLRYEDFTSKTEPTMRRVFDHLGEPFDEASLLRGPETMTPMSPVIRELVRRDPHIFSSVTETTKRWCDYVDPATAEQVQRSLRETMASMAYQPRAHSTLETTAE